MSRCKESLERAASIAELICLYHSGLLLSTRTYLNGEYYAYLYASLLDCLLYVEFICVCGPLINICFMML